MGIRCHLADRAFGKNWMETGWNGARFGVLAGVVGWIGNEPKVRCRDSAERFVLNRLSVIGQQNVAKGMRNICGETASGSIVQL